MTIMAAHMSMICSCLIFQFLIVLWNWQTVHISSKSNHIAWARILFRTSTFQIDNEPSHGTVFDFLRLDSNAEKRIFDKLLCLELLESMLRYGVKQSSSLNHLFSVKTHSFENGSMFLVQWSKIWLIWSCSFCEHL